MDFFHFFEIEANAVSFISFHNHFMDQRDVFHFFQTRKPPWNPSNLSFLSFPLCFSFLWNPSIVWWSFISFVFFISFRVQHPVFLLFLLFLLCFSFLSGCGTLYFFYFFYFFCVFHFFQDAAPCISFISFISFVFFISFMVWYPLFLLFLLFFYFFCVSYRMQHLFGVPLNPLFVFFFLCYSIFIPM